MTQKEKELLIKDLCSRLPYGVKISIPDLWTQKMEIETLDEIFKGDDGLYRVNSKGQCIEHVKPYLFPLSSMTEEQKNEWNRWKHIIPVCHYEYGDVVEEDELWDSPESFQYLIENNFDGNGLIPLGLAEDATNKNIY